MKTFVIENNLSCQDRKKPIWYFLPDSALCNAGKPFFIPEGENTAEAFLCVVIRINRLGKSIAPKFAERYYSECAPAIHFRLPELRKKLLSEHLPPDMSHSFDRSLILGEFISIDDMLKDAPLLMLKNGETTAEWSTSMLALSVDEVISAVSTVNTMKMGDYVIPALSNGTIIKIGDDLEISAGGNALLKVPVK